jgi:hypothetical protein
MWLMSLDDLAIRARLATNPDRDVRLRAFEFIRWARDVQGLRPELGDEKWAAIDLFWGGGEVLARVFPKKANLLKIRNFQGDPPDRYGLGVELTENNEWSFDLASVRYEAELARRCLVDQLPERGDS